MARRKPVVSGNALAERCQAIELLVSDVDGVLTEGWITYDSAGVELKTFHVRDGSGAKAWHLADKQLAILSGRKSRTVKTRAKELDIKIVVQGATDKLAGFRDLVSKVGFRPEQVAYIGDDLPDLPVLTHCGLAVAVADASPEVHEVAHYVTKVPGGRGALRETVELILRCQGRWQAVLEQFREGA